jgi:hypothetical protein
VAFVLKPAWVGCTLGSREHHNDTSRDPLAKYAHGHHGRLRFRRGELCLRSLDSLLQRRDHLLRLGIVKNRGPGDDHVAACDRFKRKETVRSLQV